MKPLALALGSTVRRPRPASPIPVSLVVTDLDIGGAERALVALATGLDRNRWAPRVVCLSAEGPLADVLRAADVETTCLDVSRRRPVDAIVRLGRSLRAGRPLLVQSFLFHANLASRFAAGLAHRPWVVGGLRVAEREKRWHLLLDWLTQGLGAGSVCVSHGVLEFSTRVGWLSRERLMVIPNGIDPEPFDHAEALPRERLGIGDGDHVALFVGRLEPQKGLPVLLEAASRWVLPIRSGWQLVIVGDGPETPKLKQTIDSTGILAGHVHLLGRRDDAPALLRMADVVVLPSLWRACPTCSSKRWRRDEPWWRRPSRAARSWSFQDGQAGLCLPARPSSSAPR